MTLREILLGAAEELEQHGWCRRMYCDGQNRRCVIGAICWVGSDHRKTFDFDIHESIRTAIIAVKHVALGPRALQSLSDWNDHSTAEQVIATLRRAADEFANGYRP
jgi:hypothetical protein